MRSHPQPLSSTNERARLAPGLARFADQFNVELAADDVARVAAADVIHFSAEDRREAEEELVARIQDAHPDLSAEDLAFLRGQR